jgi:hypothetical protein
MKYLYKIITLKFTVEDFKFKHKFENIRANTSATATLRSSIREYSSSVEKLFCCGVVVEWLLVGHLISDISVVGVRKLIRRRQPSSR